MKRVEGVNASYVGPDDRSGIRNGDRCRIVSDEGALQHVRWLTGSCMEQFGTVHRRNLVPDLLITSAYEDEFGFEFGRGSQSVAINVQAVHAAGGEVALLEALESEGHLENLRYAAVRAADLIRDAVAHDEAWDMVREALGQTSVDVERQAIIAAFIAAVESGDTEYVEGDE